MGALINVFLTFIIITTIYPWYKVGRAEKGITVMIKISIEPSRASRGCLSPATEAEHETKGEISESFVCLRSGISL